MSWSGWALLVVALALAAGFAVSIDRGSSSAAPVAISRTAASNYLVTFSHGTSSSAQAAAIAAAGATRISSIAPLSMDTIKVPAGSEQHVLAALRANGNVAGIALNRSRQSEGKVDPGYADQWNLPRVSWDKLYHSKSALSALSCKRKSRSCCPVAHSKKLQACSTIAVLDTGVSSAGGDLKLGAGWSAFGTNPASDPNGHGTAVASIAAAATGNGIGVAGVDFANSKILPVQVLNASGLGLDSDIVQGVVWAAKHHANVILMSFSNSGYSQALQDAISYAWKKGAVVVAATGNGGVSTPTYPAGDSGVIGVAGTDQGDQPWAESNTGSDTFLAAPATSIPADAIDGSTTSITGTSASAAMVAGAAALLMAKDPKATNGIVVGRLARNGAPVGTSAQTGNGRLNLAKAFADKSRKPVKPVGAPGGGPLVGPYQIAAAGWNVTSLTPSTVTPSTAQTFTETVTNTSSGGGTNLGCLQETLPAGWTSITAGSVSTPAGWTVSVAGQVVSAKGGTTIAGPSGQLTFTFTATAPSSTGTSTFTTAAFTATNCTGALGGGTNTSQSIAVKNATTTAITNNLSTATVINEPYAVNVSVTPTAGSGPTGTVLVSDGTDSCTVSSLTGSNPATGSCNLTSTTSGAKTIVATYNGDTNFASSASSGTAHTVNAFGTATQLGFVVQPSSTTASTAISPAVQVAAEDAFNNVVSTFPSTSLTISSTNTAFSGAPSTLTATTSSGVATFSTVEPTTVQGSATLIASGGSLASATSNTFAVTAGGGGGAIAQRGSATSANTASGTSFSITKPAGVAVGDVLIAQIETRGGTATQFPSISGWSNVTTPVDFEGGGAHHRVSLLYRVADASDVSASSYSVSLGTGGTSGAAGSIVAFSGVDTSGATPFDVAPGSYTTGTGTTISSVSAITTASPSAAVVMFAGGFESNATSSYSTTSPGALSQLYGSVSNGNGSVGAAWATKATAGSTGTGSATQTANKVWGAILIALKPAATTASQLAFTTLPSNTAAGSTMSNVVVQLQDSFGNNVSTSGVPIALTLNTGSFTGGSTTTVNTDASGKATFSNLAINAVGTYTITATSSGLTSATSNSFTITPGAADATQSTLTPTSASITANGSATQVLTVQAKDAAGNSLSTGGATVTITRQSGTGSISSVTDNGNGTYTATVTAPTATGSGVFVATLGGNPVKSGTGSQTTSTIAYVPGPADATQSTLTPTSASITANGSSTQVLTVQAKDANGNNETTGGSTVTITRQSGTGSIGSVTDNGNGTYTATVTSPTATGSGVFVATLGGNPVKSGTGSQTTSTITYVPGPVDATASTLTPTSASITANGSATQVLTVQAKDANGNNETTGGSTVTIMRQSGSGSIGSVTDNGNGTYTATVTAPTATGSGVFVATLGGNPVKSGTGSQTTSTITYVPGAADATQSTLTPTSSSITANGSATQVLTVTAKDANGNLLTTGGASVTITRQSGTGSIGSVTDNGNGTYTATVTAPTATGSGVFVATVGGNPVKSGTGSQTTSTITYVPGPADATQSTLTPTSSSITANGTATQVLTVTAKDANGNSLTTGGATVTITQQSGTGSIGSVTD
ncbi:MAG TPA: invasin domain 3-containing protein, partial [Gaiellaceae bacterium]